MHPTASHPKVRKSIETRVSICDFTSYVKCAGEGRPLPLPAAPWTRASAWRGHARSAHSWLDRERIGAERLGLFQVGLGGCLERLDRLGPIDEDPLIELPG